MRKIIKIQEIIISHYSDQLTTGNSRAGILLKIVNTIGQTSWGEVAPLPNWSKETLNQALDQLHELMDTIISIDWTVVNCLKKIDQLKLFPSVAFGLESALLSMLAPLPSYSVPVTALLMGSPQHILEQAAIRSQEGYKSAKLKVSHLSFEEAAMLINSLKNRFHLIIDVNRKWSTEESLHFFSQFPLNTFNYVEEPFNNPKDLIKFKHPLAVDESFPDNLSLTELEALPTLKALIYKPTMQGGLHSCIPLVQWCEKRGVLFVLSSSFESPLGLSCVASLAKRLGILSPVGIGTYYYLTNHHCIHPMTLSLETAVQNDKVMQDFDLESFSHEGRHSRVVKAPLIGNYSKSKDCVNLSFSTDVIRFNGAHAHVLPIS